MDSLRRAWFILPEWATGKCSRASNFLPSLPWAWREILIWIFYLPEKGWRDFCPNLREQAHYSCKAHAVSPLDERKLLLPSSVAQPRAQVMLNLRLHFLKLTVGMETAHFGPVWKNLVCLVPPSLPRRWHNEVTSWAVQYGQRSFINQPGDWSLKSETRWVDPSLQSPGRLTLWLLSFASRGLEPVTIWL